MLKLKSLFRGDVNRVPLAIKAAGVRSTYQFA
jgi:hypothetical protein